MDQDQNQKLKGEFWQQMRSTIELPKSESRSIVQLSQQSVDSVQKRNSLIKNRLMKKRLYQNKNNNSNSIVSFKGKLKTKEVKIIDKIMVRPKSCCCSDCGRESNRIKNLISLPFKTQAQHFHEMQKLGINTGLKCVAFIGKVRKSRYYDSNFHFNIPSIKYSNSQDSLESAPHSVEQELDFQSESANRQTLSVQVSPTQLDQKRGIQKFKEELSSSSPQQKYQSMFPTIDNPTSDTSRNFFNQQNHNVERQPSETEDSELSDGELNKDYVDEQNPAYQSQNTRNSESSTTSKCFYKPLNKQQSVKKIIKMHRQQSRVGEIMKLAIKKDTSTVSEKENPKTSLTIKFREDLQKPLSTNQSLSQNKILSKNSYCMEDSAQTDRSSELSKIILNQEWKGKNDSINSQQDNRQQIIRNIGQNQLESTKNILQKSSCKKNILNTKPNIMDYKINSFNLIDNNSNKKIVKNNFITSKDEYYSNCNYRSSFQLQQMIYLPLRSLSKPKMQGNDSLNLSKSNKSIKFQTIQQKNRSFSNLVENGQSMESLQNTTQDTIKNAKLIQFNRRIHTKEEEQLISLSSRSDYKLQKLHKDNLKQLTYRPKIATSIDFLERFVMNRKNYNQVDLKKKSQNDLQKSKYEQSSCSENNEKQHQKLTLVQQNGYKALFQQKNEIEKTIGNNNAKEDKFSKERSYQKNQQQQKILSLEVKQQLKFIKNRSHPKNDLSQKSIPSNNIKAS